MKDLYKYISESILDDDDDFLKNSFIPSPPKVTKNDYIFYAQAWYDVLSYFIDKGCDDQKAWANAIKLYKEWQGEWSCFVSFDDYDDFVYDHGGFDWYRDVYNYVEKASKYEQDMMNNYLDDIIEEFELGDGDSRLSTMGSNSLLVALFGDENIFRINALYYSIYQKGPYKKFYNQIKKGLIFCGLK